jgi:DNA-binding phage protein
MDLLAQLRTAIRKSPDAPGAIAARAGLPRSALTRLLRGRPMTIDGCERLAKAMGMRVVLMSIKRKGR